MPARQLRSRNQVPAVDYFYSAAKRRSCGALWPIFAPALILVAGHAFSGGFLTHGYQANRILAFDDAGITIHAMHREAAARITRRSVAELEELGHEIAPMSYEVRDYAELGLLFKLLHADDPQHPTSNEVAEVRKAITEAIADARKGKLDLSNRWESDAAKTTRKGTLAVRATLEAQWFNE
jgi:malonate decarboxylase gamma subunit